MNSLLSIKYAVVSFVLTMAIGYLSFKVNHKNPDFISTLIALLAFSIIILSIIGLIKSAKSLKEAKRFQVFFGFTINLFFLVLYSYLIISNS